MGDRTNPGSQPQVVAALEKLILALNEMNGGLTRMEGHVGEHSTYAIYKVGKITRVDLRIAGS